MPNDLKISELPVAASISGNDIGVLVSSGNDYQFAFVTLLQYVAANLQTGSTIKFVTAIPQNNTGKNGDVSINTSSQQFYQKQNGEWLTVYTSPAANSQATTNTVIYGLGLPGGTIGSINDTYINTATGVFYKKSAGGWGQVFSMQSGPAGAPGPKGDIGAAGVDGKSILSGAINPSNLNTGTDGDFYINTNTYKLFGPKVNGNWGSGITMVALNFDDKADKTYVDAQDAAETLARTTADTALQTNITNEATSRIAADTTLQNTKVDKVSGKGLSTEDYTTAEKSKLSGVVPGATANSSDAQLRDRSTHTGTQTADTIIDGTTNKAYTATEKTKLAGMATGATANSSDAQLRDRSTHTGTQLADTIIDGTTNKAYTAAEKIKLTGIATAATANSTDTQLRDRSTHTGTQSADSIVDGTSNKAFSAAEKTKLAGITIAATANDTDANLKNRANHTGSQLAATISDFPATVRTAVLTGLSTTTNLVITASDTILSAFGKLQRQVTDLLTTAQNVTGKFTFKGFINLFPGSAPVTPVNGDMWMETANNRFRAYKGTQTVDVIMNADNYALVGTGQRMLSANGYGDLTATEAVLDGVISDGDLITAMIGATYTSGNKFTATIGVAGKSIYQGQRYYDLTTGYFYLAVADNKTLRLTGA